MVVVRYNLIILIFLSLTGCSLISSDGIDTEPNAQRTASAVKSRYPSSIGEANKKPTKYWNAIPSSNNTCIDNFNFLKSTSPDDYSDFEERYSRISKVYGFLNKNKNIMDPDARSILSISLNMKLYTLCEEIRYKGYQLVRDKVRVVENSDRISSAEAGK
ncbi:hypothetical protein BTJ39_09770 [Izhakiella australiensis]|uniref:Lipoprotein n=1 Tax=Izhakiella australiensis TaxID=1926881 RepID=A0A1S8YMD3_9GAMM|nr:hypothetical protein [Izhakiella australiensis]OON40174.1 hypothetical protein BTJ39_09770 [Izhakiella australiensis]